MPGFFKEYQWSDAWFLTALLICKDWSPLHRVIHAGDWLNHAIFTTKEVNRALSVLIATGYVEINAALEMRVTEKALALCDKIYEKSGAFRKLERIVSKLKRSAFESPIPAVQYFSQEDVKRAYQCYVKDSAT